jgi:hypothetical protein
VAVAAAASSAAAAAAAFIVVGGGEYTTMRNGREIMPLSLSLYLYCFRFVYALPFIMVVRFCPCLSLFRSFLFSSVRSLVCSLLTYVLLVMQPFLVR